MKRTVALILLCGVAFIGLGLTIKLFTDFPNSVPVGSDFFVLQRNNDFINASVSQVKQDWFNNPVFSGNGGIQGVWTATTFVGDGSQLTGIQANSTNLTVINTITNNVFVNTNVTLLTSNVFENNVYQTNVTVEVPGGFTNLNLTPLSLMMSDANDAESSLPNGVGILTNNGAGGMGWATSIAFDDFYVQNAFLTNVFLQLTNDLLSTDGNGQITNVSIGTGLTFTGNTLSATGVSSLTPATNNDTVVSNGVVAHTITVAGTANQISSSTGTSQQLASNPSTTLSLPNPLIAPGAVSVSSLTNTGNMLMKGTETNSSMAAGFVLSDSLGGRSASFNAINMTNQGYSLPTNNVGGGAFVFGGPGTAATLYDTNISAATTLKLFDISACGSTAGGIKIYVTCSGGTDRVLTFPAGCSGAGLGTPPAVTITNAKAAFFDVIYKPGATPVTNVFWSPVY